MITLRFILTRIHYVMALLPLLSARKVLNLVKAFALYLLRSEHSVTTPPVVVLTLTHDCNLSCIMCLRNTLTLRHVLGAERKGDMDFELLKDFLVSHGRSIALVRLHGGEPTYYPDFIRVIDLLHETGIAYNIITNGSLLTPEVCGRLVDSYCVGVGISLDAATPGTYSRIRRGGDLAQITASIDYLNGLKAQKRSKRPVLSASMCVFSFNLAEMKQLVRYCHEHGIPSLSVGEGWDFQTAHVSEEQLVKHHVDQTHEAICEACAEARRLGIILRIRFPSLSQREYTDIPFHAGKVLPTSCFNLYASAWLQPNGEVIGCSSVSAGFGNLHSVEFDRIWNGAEFGYVRARRAFRHGQSAAVCKDCVYTGGFWS